MNKINKIKLSILILAMAVISATAFGQIEQTKPIKKNFNAVYGKYYEGDAIQLSQDYYSPVYNYTFYLPYPAYVYVETTGELYMEPNVLANIGLSVDNLYMDPGTNRWTENDGIEDFGTIFHTSRVYRLTPGKHTIYIIGGTGDVGQVAKIAYMSINAIASSNGELVEDRQWSRLNQTKIYGNGIK